MKRRSFLGSFAGSVAAATAGCLAESSPDDGDAGATQIRTSFTVLSDVTAAVAGDRASVENVVPAGQHGHGWEPSSAVQRDVLTADAFVYVGEGFQPWADDVVETIREDDADVEVVEARHGIDLLPAPDDGGQGDPDGDEHDGHDGHDDDDGDNDHDGHDDHGSHDDDDHDDGHDHDTGGDDHQDDHDEHQDGDHTHGGSDPHFWIDPLRLKHAVENVSAGLSEVDPDAAGAFDENAGRFESELEDLHREFETRLADRDRSAVLVAGHNAFQYLGRRYGFQIHALTGIAPDAEPSPRDVTRAQHVIEEHDLEHVLVPALESGEWADRLVEDTDATATLPITAIAGRTREWRDEGWGYLDVMEEVNLATLERALGAK